MLVQSIREAHRGAPTRAADDLRLPTLAAMFVAGVIGPDAGASLPPLAPQSLVVTWLAPGASNALGLGESRMPRATCSGATEQSGLDGRSRLAQTESDVSSRRPQTLGSIKHAKRLPGLAPASAPVKKSMAVTVMRAEKPVLPWMPRADEQNDGIIRTWIHMQE